MNPENAKQRSNMRDVARHAGVSVATVSRVLSGTSKVSEPTRRKVQASIDLLNFVPSPAARAINSGRTNMVGALVPTLDHAIFARYLHALEEELAVLGLSLVVATTGGDPDLEAQRAEDLMNLGVEGLIVSGITHSAEFQRNVQRRRLPVIATSYHAPDNPWPTIGYDNAAIAALTLDHLVGLGHRRIAVLHGPIEGNDRTRARVEALRGLAPEAAVFVPVTLSYDVAAETAKALAKDSADITAFLCVSDVLALGALFGLQQIGVTVPDTISIIGMEDLPASRTTSPSLSSVRLPSVDMGRASARAMSAWVEQGIEPKGCELKFELVLRQSTCKARS